MGKQGKQENTTPLAAVFFKIVLIGGLVGVIVPIASAAAGFLTGGPPNLGAVPIASLFGFFIGVAFAASAAAPAIGLHTWAAARKPELRASVAALGAIAGPVIALTLVTGSFGALAAVPVIHGILLLLAASLTAVYCTRPLR